jgi:2-hydroxychromene-2-carboxylate isomerase
MSNVTADRPLVLEFWFDFASTYSYLSAVRIEPLAEAAGLAVQWRPFLLGPIFRAQGWETSPFNLYPAKGRYMVRDVTRVAAGRGRVFHMFSRFPQHSVKAARCALAAAEQGRISMFSRCLFEVAFEQAADISDDAVLGRVSEQVGLDFARLSERSGSSHVKQALRDATHSAAQAGIFGAPTFRTPDGEIFWGDDRLEQAIAWCRQI